MAGGRVEAEPKTALPWGICSLPEGHRQDACRHHSPCCPGPPWLPRDSWGPGAWHEAFSQTAYIKRRLERWVGLGAGQR